MPSFQFSDEDLQSLLSFLFHGDPGEPVAPPKREAPRVERTVRYEEVDELFQDTCIHCHLEDSKGGIGNTGGGWGFTPRRLDISSYERLKRGALGDDGVRRSVLDPIGGQEPILLQRLRRRVHENARDHLPPLGVTPQRGAPASQTNEPLGMPLGLPALSPKEIALIEAWLRQGAPGPKHRGR